VTLLYFAIGLTSAVVIAVVAIVYSGLARQVPPLPTQDIIKRRWEDAIEREHQTQQGLRQRKERDGLDR